MIKWQGGDPRVIEDYSLFPQHKKEIKVLSVKDGYIKRLEALEIGLSAMLLGAGRESKEDNVDLSVGIKVCKKVGDYVSKGDTLAILYANEKGIDEAYSKVLNAYHFSNDEVKANDIIIDIVK